MNHLEEQGLKELVKSGKTIIWNPDEDTAKVVVSITKRHDEPGLCANFSNGEYVSLDGCEVADFAIIQRLKSDPGLT